jgi:hypothetical protein
MSQLADKEALLFIRTSDDLKDSPLHKSTSPPTWIPLNLYAPVNRKLLNCFLTDFSSQDLAEMEKAHKFSSSKWQLLSQARLKNEKPPKANTGRRGQKSLPKKKSTTPPNHETKPKRHTSTGKSYGNVR